MNYFELFDLPVAPKLDDTLLRQRFLALSKRYHPDFYTLEDQATQQEILEKSTLVNRAYRVLSDFDRRLHYLLELKGVLAEEGQNQLPQAFLLEVMDLNEALMELELEPDAHKQQQTLAEVQQWEQTLYTEIADLIAHYDDQQVSPETLKKLGDFYLKKRYLLRIKENVAKFAPH